MSEKLLPQNRTLLESALEEILSPKLSPETIATLWDPARCPVKALPWLAWALHVDDWHDDWPESTKRQVIAAAVPVHRSKGTLSSVRRLLSAFGVTAVIREWWQTGGVPHTFEIDILAGGQYTDPSVPILGPALTVRMQSLINSKKPVRSHYTLSVGALYNAQPAAGGMLRRPTQIIAAGISQPAPAPIAWQAMPAYGKVLRRPITVIVGAAAQPAPSPISTLVDLCSVQSIRRPVSLNIFGAIQVPSLITTASRQLASAMPRPTIIANGSGTISI